MTAGKRKGEEKRDKRISARIKSSLLKRVEAQLKGKKLEKWTMSDYVEEAMLRLADAFDHE